MNPVKIYLYQTNYLTGIAYILLSISFILFGIKHINQQKYIIAGLYIIPAIIATSTHYLTNLPKYRYKLYIFITEDEIRYKASYIKQEKSIHKNTITQIQYKKTYLALSTKTNNQHLNIGMLNYNEQSILLNAIKEFVYINNIKLL